MKKNYPTHIITHHSNGSHRNPCMSTQAHDVYITDSTHKTRWRGFTSKIMKRPDNGQFWHVGYHLVTDMKTGITTQTRGFNEEGAHTLGMNTSSIGWLFIGNYTECSPDRIDDIISKREFLSRAPEIMKEFNIPIKNIVPHRHFAKKDCHGRQLPDNYFSKFIVGEKKLRGDVAKLRDRVVIIEGIVQSIQTLLVILINMLSSKKLSSRETNNYKRAV